ncbi:MAG: 30S ribosomal protein S3, partial [Prevotella intermedia]
WICRGEVYNKVDLTPNFTQEKSNGRSNNSGARSGRGNRRRNNNR